MSPPVMPIGPHGRISVETPRDRLLTRWLDRLWQEYRRRVSYVQMYEELLRIHNGAFVNDHIAFRTFALANPGAGISSLSRMFEAFGYRPAGCYDFPDKQLTAIHYQHPVFQFPKIFISELRVWELDDPIREIIERSTRSYSNPLNDDLLARVWNHSSSKSIDELVEQLAAVSLQLPWQPPEKQDVYAVNSVSQYGAWVLVHGYAVNHFTSLVNSHGVPALSNLESTVQALRQAGVPMKTEIEGAPGTPLRQTATEAVMVDVEVRNQGEPATMPWTYAYFELAQRDWFIDPATGQETRFEGFLGNQATHLFNMTRVQ